MPITDATVSVSSFLADAWGSHHVSSGGWIVMTLGMALFWGAAIAIVLSFMRTSWDRRPPSPEEILRRRLANGSTGVEEYNKRLATLSGDSPQAAQPPADDRTAATHALLTRETLDEPDACAAAGLRRPHGRDTAKAAKFLAAGKGASARARTI